MNNPELSVVDFRIIECLKTAARNYGLFAQTYSGELCALVKKETPGIYLETRGRMEKWLAEFILLAQPRCIDYTHNITLIRTCTDQHAWTASIQMTLREDRQLDSNVAVEDPVDLSQFQWNLVTVNGNKIIHTAYFNWKEAFSRVISVVEALSGGLDYSNISCEPPECVDKLTGRFHVKKG